MDLQARGFPPCALGAAEAGWSPGEGMAPVQCLMLAGPQGSIHQQLVSKHQLIRVGAPHPAPPPSPPHLFVLSARLVTSKDG